MDAMDILIHLESWKQRSTSAMVGDIELFNQETRLNCSFMNTNITTKMTQDNIIRNMMIITIIMGWLQNGQICISQKYVDNSMEQVPDQTSYQYQVNHYSYK